MDEDREAALYLTRYERFQLLRQLVAEDRRAAQVPVFSNGNGSNGLHVNSFQETSSVNITWNMRLPALP